MERCFVIVANDFDEKNKFGDLLEQLNSVACCQLFIQQCEGKDNSKSLALNFSPFKWAVFTPKESSLTRGTGLLSLQEHLQHMSGVSETWSATSFAQITHHIVDIVLVDGSFESSNIFSQSNSIVVHDVLSAKCRINHRLFWRGTLKMRDPYNLNDYRKLESVDLNHPFDELDHLLFKVKSQPQLSHSSQKTFYSPFLELVGSFCSQSVPFAFYTSFVVTLSVNSDSFWDKLNKEVSFLFRLDYSSEEVENWEKDSNVKSFYFLSHFIDKELQLFALKDVEKMQHLANNFMQSLRFSHPLDEESSNIESGLESESRKDQLPMENVINMYSLEKETRRLQLLALRTWIQENGPLTPIVTEDILEQVALAVLERSRSAEPTARKAVVVDDWEKSYIKEGDILRWKLSQRNAADLLDRPLAANPLLQPNGCKTVAVDVQYILRVFNLKNPIMQRSPKKKNPKSEMAGQHVHSNLKPSVDLETAKSAGWPDCFLIKYHGIHYNVDDEAERREKQQNGYKDKWVQAETSSWCNPWSFNTPVAYQISAASATVPPQQRHGNRTPRKSSTRDLLQSRKSPRLLAKTELRPRRGQTPVKKANALTPRKAVQAQTFKQKLKIVIIKVLNENGISTRDDIFRTCANKLSVICLELLKEAKHTATSRQMYQVAKAHAKQIIEFVKSA